MKETSFLRHISQTILSDNWGKLTRYTFALKRSDGTWQEQTREVYDRGNGATCLLHNRQTDTVLLVKQFRLPCILNDHDGFLIEAPAGLLEGLDPAERMRAELEEETGFRVSTLELVFDAFMSPGSVSERISCFTGTYSGKDQVSDGGGHRDEGEDIEVLHVPFDEAMSMIADGRIMDGKTIMLLQHMALSRR